MSSGIGLQRCTSSLPLQAAHLSAGDSARCPFLSAISHPRPPRFPGLPVTPLTQRPLIDRAAVEAIADRNDRPTVEAGSGASVWRSDQEALRIRMILFGPSHNMRRNSPQSHLRYLRIRIQIELPACSAYPFAQIPSPPPSVADETVTPSFPPIYRRRPHHILSPNPGLSGVGG